MIRAAPADTTVFPGVAQVFCLRHASGDLDGTWKETVFGATSLSLRSLGPSTSTLRSGALEGGEPDLLGPRRRLRRGRSQVRVGTALRALASFRTLGISTLRLAGRANIAHARRDLLNHKDAFAVYGI